MKKIFSKIIILYFFSPVLFAETTIRITNGEWEPYLSNYSYEYGLASHIIKEAYRLEGINVEWGFFTWARSYQMAKDDIVWDASAVWWPTEETKKDFFISEPVIKTSNVFFHLKSYKFDWNKLEDLRGVTIGITNGYDYGKEFMDALKDKKLDTSQVSKDEQNFGMMLLGRIDVFPNDPVVGYAQLRNMFAPDKVKLFTHHPKEFAKRTLNLIISKKSKNGRLFLEKFNSGLKKLKTSGRLDQMYKDLKAGKYDKHKNTWKEQVKASSQ